MDEDTRPPPTERLVDSLETGRREQAVATVEQLATADADDRKEALRAVRSVVDERPAAVEPVVPALSALLTAEERPVRLRCAKLFVAVAAAAPDAALPVVSTLADRLADEDEFYFVRARSAEALGYVALEHPDAVASPEVVADLRIGLEFDEPEVREKLAKALEHVALGDPRRLRHQVANLAEHLDDDAELVRYHLCTALVAVGCEYPATLADDRAAIADRLADESAFVRGRAAEALGLLGRGTDASLPTTELAALADDEEGFAARRARFATSAVDDGADEGPADVGTVEGVRETTDDAVDGIASPDGDHQCPHCGLDLPEAGPPLCPRCGAPH